MIEGIIQFLSGVPWELIILVALLLTFVENIFPPAPCDTILVFMGTLVGIKVVGFFQLWLAATIGSALGFVLMLYLGRKLGRKLIGYHRFKFLSEERLVKPNKWLGKYGYWIILGNRFLSGTRGVVSFLAGMSKMKISYTVICGIISSVIWNAVLIFLGMVLGNNWKLADKFINLYGGIFLLILLGFAIIVFVLKLFKKKKNKTKNEIV